MSAIDPLGITKTTELTGVCGDALLRTPRGARKAKNVRAGDLIVTRDHGLQPIRMIWTITLSSGGVLQADDAALRIGTRAIGPMMPKLSLAVAPDQNVWIPAYLLSEPVAGHGGLIPARGLAGWSDLLWRDRMMDDAIFYNFGFDRHVVICVSGLYISSYRPVARKLGELKPDLRDRLLRSYPQLREKRDPFPPCSYDCVAPDAYCPGQA